MKMSLDNTPFLDRSNGQPVEGRIRVYEHGTDVYENLYTLEGDQYITAANPQIVHGGYPDSSLFADLGIVDIHLDKYIGAEGQMSVESPDEDFEQIDVFEFGLDYDISQATANIVNDIGELRTTSTGLGLVTVIWYSEEGDCCPRQYIWDPLCQNEEDGGYVIRSDVSDTGRWVLLWADEVLPCTVYGVRPGDESNMNLLLSYPDVVGSFSLKTAPCVRFVTGTYTSDVNYYTAKELCFDKGAQFLTASFQCNSARMFDKPSDYVADFVFTNTSMEAHSSWFRSIESFLTCGAKTLVVDSADNFTNNTLRFPTNVANATVVFSSNTRLPITYVNTGRLGLSRVNLVGSAMFDATDKIAFSYMAIRDEWWQSPTSVDWVTKVSARSTSSNVLLLSNFKYVNAYIDAVQANGDTSIDLAGRYVTRFDNTAFTDVRNVVCRDFDVDMSGRDVTLHNVKAENCEVLCRYLVCDDNCDLHFTEAEPVVNAGWFMDSKISGATTWSQNTSYEFKRCAVSVTFRRVLNNEDNENGLFFEDCQLLENCVIESKALSMKHCTTLNNTIKVYPYYDSEKSMYRMDVTLEGNIFSNNNPIEFTRVETDGNGNHYENCTDIRVNWYIVGNTFAGNSEGLRCRYWQYRFGNHPNSVFIYRGDFNESSVTYKGNLGLCPSSSGVGINCSDLATTDWYIHEVGSDKYSYFVANWGYKRIMPNVRDAGFGYSLYYFGTNSVDNNEFGIKTYYGTDVRMQRASLYMYPQSALDSDSNGDFFKHSPCMIGLPSGDNPWIDNPNDTHFWRYLD